MIHRLRPHLTYANVVATLCLFILLGGTAAAVDGSLAGQNTVGSTDIINGEVLNADLGASAVSSGKIAAGQVKNADLGPNAAASNTIANGGVKTIDIADGGVTGADVGNESLSEDDIQDIVSSGGVTQVAVGEEKTLLQDGPFTVTATCFESSGETPLFSQITITSTEEHSVAELFGGANEMSASGTGLSAPDSPFNFVGTDFFAAAPSGATLGGYFGAGVHVLGYDECTAVATAIGTSELDGP